MDSLYSLASYPWTFLWLRVGIQERGLPQKTLQMRQ